MTIPSSAPASLPGPPADFIGRTAELAQIGRFAEARLGVLLTGDAGTGKSWILRKALRELEVDPSAAVAVTATHLGSVVPFSAFLPLLDQLDDRARDPFELAGLLRRRLGDAALVAVDDVQLLDSASAGIIHGFASDGGRVLMAARSGEPLPDAITALLERGDVRRIEVAPFGEADSGRLIGSLLPGQVDPGLVHSVFLRSGGNALFVRELVLGARESGAIIQRSGVWVLTREPPIAESVLLLVRAQLGRLDEELRRAAELLAIADSVSLDHADRMIDEGCLEAGERAGIWYEDTGRLRLRHPLYREALLDALPPRRRRRLLGELIRELGDADAPADRVAVAGWRIDLGLPVEPGELLRLASETQARDAAVAERMIRAAVEAGGGIPAHLALANLFTHQHRTAEAETVFEALSAAELSGAEHQATLAAHAFLLAMPGQRPADALTLIDDVEGDPDVAAARTTAIWRSGFPDAAMRSAEPLLRRADLRPDTRAHLALTYCSAAIYAQRSARASSLLDGLDAMCRDAAPWMPEAPDSARLVHASLTALGWSDPREGDEGIARESLRMLRAGRDGERAQFALLLGVRAKRRGELRLAVDHLRVAQVGSGTWTPTTRPWVLSELAGALSLLGETEEAATLLGELAERPMAPLYELDAAIAGAIRAAVAGRRDRARDTLSRAVATWRDSGQRLRLCDARMILTCLGDRDAAAELAASEHPAGNTQLDAMAAHASAVADGRSPEALSAAARRLEGAGLLWFAAEAQRQVVAAIPATDRTARGLAAAVLHRTLRRCDGLELLVSGDPVAGELSPREQQSAELAARGLSDAEIAARLGISVRTVGSHLGSVYAKLGLRGRRELSPQLPPAPRAR